MSTEIPMIKTSYGRYVSPQSIESAMWAEDESRVVVIMDSGASIPLCPATSREEYDTIMGKIFVVTTIPETS